MEDFIDWLIDSLIIPYFGPKSHLGSIPGSGVVACLCVLQKDLELHPLDTRTFKLEFDVHPLLLSSLIQACLIFSKGSFLLNDDCTSISLTVGDVSVIYTHIYINILYKAQLYNIESVYNVDFFFLEIHITLCHIYSYRE